jgi:hypothetical protein
LAAQLVFKGHFISKFSALSEFIEHLPTASDFGVNPRYRAKLKGIFS